MRHYTFIMYHHIEIHEYTDNVIEKFPKCIESKMGNTKFPHILLKAIPTSNPENVMFKISYILKYFSLDKCSNKNRFQNTTHVKIF